MASVYRLKLLLLSTISVMTLCVSCATYRNVPDHR